MWRWLVADYDHTLLPPRRAALPERTREILCCQKSCQWNLTFLAKFDTVRFRGEAEHDQFFLETICFPN